MYNVSLVFHVLDICFDQRKSYNDASCQTYTVDLVIFASLIFREFQILGLFTKFIIREFSFFFSSAIIIIIFAGFLNSRICPPRKIREN